MEARVRGRDIIAQVIENMRSQGEELRYSTIVPAAYDVYLHAADFQRLESLGDVIGEQARRALDEELQLLNRESRIESRVREALHKPRRPYEREGPAWEIRLISDPNEELAQGDILVDSTLVIPDTEVVSGSRTRRIVTTRHGDRVESRTAPPNAPTSASPLATLSYRDENGDGVFRMEKPQVVVGRGGPGYWVDLKLRTVPDVSRDHLRLRYDEAEHRFYIKDLSTLGTSVNGAPIPSSIELRGGEKVDRNVEVPLPPEAEIGLAGAVVIRFRSEVRS
jgi:hypothetical protein